MAGRTARVARVKSGSHAHPYIATNSSSGIFKEKSEQLVLDWLDWDLRIDARSG